ncbi:hypothetical protein HNR60_000986 [Rhodopseudomonas rhenobacensis]|uniref:Uncharacterized protein n=1 Tax=Rhodopseudomonas rhenobacensis TaxID=87461 RepID=A0A7W7Z1M9_9BRAD|nr:hypothetical protein [Rhodopseudomonas rhenobacensis]
MITATPMITHTAGSIMITTIITTMRWLSSRRPLPA